MLHELADAGNTVVVIEHNLEVIKTADWIVDLGPEGGDGGGRIVAVGTPEDVARVKESYTGGFLKEMLGRRAKAGGGRRRSEGFGLGAIDKTAELFYVCSTYKRLCCGVTTHGRTKVDRVEYGATYSG